MNKENNKRIIKNSFYLYFRTFIVLILNLYLSRILLKTLGIVDFGIYNVVAGIVMIMTFVNNSMASATERFFAFELGVKNNNSVKLKNTFKTSVFIHLLLAVFVFILLETVGVWIINNLLNFPNERMFIVNRIFQFSIFTILFIIIQVPFKAILIAHERFMAFSVISVFDIFLKLGSVFIVNFIFYDALLSYSILLLIVNFFISSIYVFFSILKFKEVTFNLGYDKLIFKEMLSYTSWSLFGNLASIGSTQGVNILLNMFFNPIVNAAMAIAIQVQTGVRTFVNNVQVAVSPQIIKSYAEKNIDYMIVLVYTAAKFSFFILLILVFPIIVETKFILNIWLDETPEYAISLVRLSLIVILIDSFSEAIKTCFQATGKIKKYQMIVGGVLLLNVPISYVFLKFGSIPETVMYVSIVLSIFSFFVRLYLLRKVLPFSPIEYFKEVVLKGLLVGFIASFSLISHCFFPEGFLRFVSLVIFEFILSIIAIYFLGLSLNEKKLLGDSLKRLKQKLNRFNFKDKN